MSESFVSSRRDPRYLIAPGRGSIEISVMDNRSSRAGRLKCLSASGLCCELPGDGLTNGSDTLLSDCSLRLGPLTIRGEFTIRNSRPIGDGIVEYGGLFYPASTEDEALLRDCVEGLARGDGPPARMAATDPAGLFVRCGSCHASRWLTEVTERHTCNCGTILGLGEFADVAVRDQLGELARMLGRQHQIDLPAAYAIVAGLMTLEHSLELGHGSSAACRLVAAEREARGSATRFDPAFKDAVEAGLLSPLQAFERGRRETFARKIADRHNLGVEQAYAVADNRISLLNAIRASRTPRFVVPSQHTGHRVPRHRWVAVAAVVIMGLATASAWSHFREAEPVDVEVLPDVTPSTRRHETTTDRSAALRAATVVERDGQGRPVRAIGPDPHSVLLAVCESLTGIFSLEAVEVTSSFPPSAEARIGIVRDLASRDLFVVHLRRNPESRRWFAGDGIEPLSPVPPPPALGTMSR